MLSYCWLQHLWFLVLFLEKSVLFQYSLKPNSVLSPCSAGVGRAATSSPLLLCCLQGTWIFRATENHPQLWYIHWDPWSWTDPPALPARLGCCVWAVSLSVHPAPSVRCCVLMKPLPSCCLTMNVCFAALFRLHSWQPLLLGIKTEKAFIIKYSVIISYRLSLSFLNLPWYKYNGKMANHEKSSLLRFCLVSLRSNDVLVIQVNWLCACPGLLLILIDYVLATPQRFFYPPCSAHDMMLAKVSPVLLGFALNFSCSFLSKLFCHKVVI